MIYRKPFLLILFFFIVGCVSKENDISHRPMEMKFDVNPELLGNAVHHEGTGLSLHPPDKWIPLSERLFDEAADRFIHAQSDGELFFINPKYIFLNTENGSAMVLSEIVAKEGKSLEPGIAKVFRSELIDRLGNKDYMETDFLKDGIHFYQYLLQSDNVVNFKLLFQTTVSNLFQLDYIVPQAVYAVESKAIESSIGSIHIREK